MVSQKMLFLSCFLSFLAVGTAWAPRSATKDLVLFQALPTKRRKPKSLRSQASGNDSFVAEMSVETKEATPAPPVAVESDAASKIPFLKSSEFQTAVSVLGGTILSFALNNYGAALGPIKASSYAGLVAAMLLPEKLAIAAFCGAFAGMAKLTVVPTLWASLSLGVTCAAMLSFFDKKKWLVGLGGRLGFIAQLSCTSHFIASRLVWTPPAVVQIVGTYPTLASLIAGLPLATAFSVVGALTMRFWKEALAKATTSQQNKQLNALLGKLSGSVAAVSVTGLLFAYASGKVAGTAFCGAFIAMSAPTRLASYGALVGASAMGGVSQALISGLLMGGWAGKLGTASLLAVVLYRALAAMVPTPKAKAE